MKNNQNEQSKRKPLFQEGTLLHTVFYKITQRVQAGEISFAKVFWIGFLIIAVINIVAVFVFGISQTAKEILDIISCSILARHLWFARKQVYHPAWFYIGFGIAILPILLFAIAFIKGFIPAFLASSRGY